MSEFQVGDRVSVEGVVTHVSVSDMGLIEVEGRTGGRSDVVAADATLVERPQRKLRVGSVWHPQGYPKDRYMVIGYDKDGTEDFLDITHGGIHGRSSLTFDGRNPWREVPVEELEREAGR